MNDSIIVSTASLNPTGQAYGRILRGIRPGELQVITAGHFYPKVAGLRVTNWLYGARDNYHYRWLNARIHMVGGMKGMTLRKLNERIGVLETQLHGN